MSRTLKLWEKMVAVFASVALVVSLCPAVAMADTEGVATRPADGWSGAVLTITEASIWDEPATEGGEATLDAAFVEMLDTFSA